MIKMRDLLTESTLPVGSMTTFKILDTPLNEFYGYSKMEIKKHDGKKCKIVKIEQSGRTPSQNFYTVKFDDGFVLEGLSGYQLQ